MTAVLEKPTASVVATAAADPVASWWARAGALAVDVLPGAGVVAAMALVERTSDLFSWVWWVSVVAGVAVLLALMANRLLVPAMTGWTLGRALFGIAVVRPPGKDTPVGPWRLLARDLAHLLDTLSLFVGWAWPLWDSRKRTFADLLLNTEVRRVPRPQRDVRRYVTAAVTVAALLAAAGAGVSYLGVYRHQHAVDDAREQILDQGPDIVQGMLSYHSASMKDDFVRAQGLVTDSYRKQLIEQQQAVEKRGALTNEYWVVAKSVVSVTPDRATMLLFMQGQRQASQEQVRFITATARVNFEKHADKWLLADLTVLQRPAARGAPEAPPPPGQPPKPEAPK